MTKKLIDPITGEIIEVTSYKTVEQDKAIKEKQKREHEYYIKGSRGNSKPFVFTEMNIGGLQKLNNKHLGYFLLMQTYTDYDNVLKENKDSKAPMTRKQLEEKLNVTKNTMTSLIKTLKKEGLVKEEKIEVYGKKRKAIILTDIYSFRKSLIGDNKHRKTDNAVKVFMQELQEVYEQDNVKPADIGFIYKCIPYVHYDSNYLVHNPNMNSVQEADFITVGELAKVQGLTRSTTQQRLSTLTWKNMYVFGRMKVGNQSESKLKVNPHVIYRKAGAPKSLGIEFHVRNTKKAQKQKKK